MSASSPELPQVLVIDDEVGPRESLRMLLKPNYQVHTADCVEEGVRLLREKSPDAVVTDIRMPGANGIEGLRRIREIDPDVAVIMLTGFGALETAQEALRLGANDYINKPFDAVEMRDVISRNVERTRLQRASHSAAAEIRELNDRLQKELALKERLAHLGQASAEFVHDLSNPLTIVWGYVQLLARKIEQQENAGTDAASLKELKIIEQNVRMCRDLITMWQSYGRATPQSARLVSVTEIVRQVIKAATGMAAQHGVTLSPDCCEEVGEISGDQLQVQRAVQNVVANAIQAAADRHGSVRVLCRQVDRNVEITVIDNGNGIAPDEMPRIFDPYFTTRQGKSGTGLGLYITKKVVDDHHGSIKVDSSVGHGTTFIIRVPLAAT